MIGSRLRPGACVPAAVLALLFGIPAAGAQNGAGFGKQIWETKGGCSFCHGWAGDGNGDERSEGNAPSFRVAHYLTREIIVETVKCGRPGTAMPYFDRFAYTDDRCYGMTAADAGPSMPTRGDKTLQAREIDALADFLLANFVDKGEVTFEQCVEFFGQEVNECAQYPKASATN